MTREFAGKFEGDTQKYLSVHAIALIEVVGRKTFGQGASSKLEGKGIEMQRHCWMAMVGGVWAAWAAVACGAQSTPAAAPAPSPATAPAPTPAAGLVPCSVAPQPVPCGTTPAVSGKQSATEQFPFPDEANGGGASLTPYATPAKLSGVPQTPDAPGAASGATPGATSGAAPAVKKGLDGDFPFPGEEGKDAGVSGTRDASGGSDANSSSSSSSSSNSGDDTADPAGAPDAAGTPDAAGLTDKGSEGTPGRHLLHRVNPVGTKLQTADEREAEDLSVAKFYTDTGDLQGAYLRSQDAVKTAPDDPEAHFALATAALKLKKPDEAIAEYNACLKLDPTDKEAKEARKALSSLKP